MQRRMKVKKIDLHSCENNGLHIGLTPLESWELLAKISKESWFIETGIIAPNKLDKTKVKIIKLKDL